MHCVAIVGDENTAGLDRSRPTVRTARDFITGLEAVVAPDASERRDGEEA